MSFLLFLGFVPHLHLVMAYHRRLRRLGEIILTPALLFYEYYDSLFETFIIVALLVFKASRGLRHTAANQGSPMPGQP